MFTTGAAVSSEGASVTAAAVVSCATFWLDAQPANADMIISNASIHAMLFLVNCFMFSSLCYELEFLFHDRLVLIFSPPPFSLNTHQVSRAIHMNVIMLLVNKTIILFELHH